MFCPCENTDTPVTSVRERITVILFSRDSSRTGLEFPPHRRPSPNHVHGSIRAYTGVYDHNDHKTAVGPCIIHVPFAGRAAHGHHARSRSVSGYGFRRLVAIHWPQADDDGLRKRKKKFFSKNSQRARLNAGRRNVAITLSYAH